MWVVGSLATVTLGTGPVPSSLHPPPHPLYCSNTSPAPLPPARALWDPRAARINGSDGERVDLQRWQLGASARWGGKKLSGINKQAGRQVGRTQINPRLYPRYALPLHLFKSSSSHTPTACSATFCPFRAPPWVLLS